MKDVIIIGNSGAARECYQLLHDCVWASPTMRYSLKFKGFLSYQGYKGNLAELKHFTIGDTSTHVVSENQQFIIGVGKPELRQKIFLEMKSRGAQFLNLISPWSYLPDGLTMGEGNIVSSGCNFSGASSCGDGNYFNGGIRMGHNVTMGDFNFFAPAVTILGSATIGNNNFFAVQSVLLDKAVVGNNNHVAPSSVVFKGCKDHCFMSGNPALNIARKNK